MNWGEGKTLPFIRISTKKYRWNDGVRQSVPQLDGDGEEGQVCVRSQAFSLCGAQLRSKSCFSMDVQSPAADA